MVYSPTNDEKCAFFDQKAWTIAHKNDEKSLFFIKMHGL